MFSAARMGLMTAKGASGPITVMSSNTAAYTSGLNTTITLPAGIVAGELLLIFISSRDYQSNGLTTSSSGWTKVTGASTSSTGRCHSVFMKIASATNTLVVTIGANSYKTSVGYRIKNANSCIGDATIGQPDGNYYINAPTLNLGAVRDFICFTSLGCAYDMYLNSLPPNYTNQVSRMEDNISNVDTHTCRKAVLAASTVSPGSWRMSSSATALVVATAAVYNN
jgi:hypothetical protein